jgi:4-hydroxyphenylpyruvate dioxygenase
LEQLTKRVDLKGHKPRAEDPAKGTFDLPIVRGPGGAVFYLLSDDLDHQPFFDRDFAPVPGATPVNDLSNVDHFNQALVPNLFLSGLLFYRAVFDFKAEEQHDVFDPHGMVRSRTVSNANGRVRTSLNSSLSPGTMTQRFVEKSGFAAYHHFAFHCDDIFAYAARLAPDFAMKVPPNYYDDLTLRFNVSAELIDKIRPLNILYDRDAHGSYFQLYSRQLNGFFFEVVQRNGYTGLGAANAPVRMLAQSIEFETTHALDL